MRVPSTSSGPSAHRDGVASAPVGVTLGDLLTVVVRAGTDHAFTKEVHEFYLHAFSEFAGNVTTMK